MAIRAFMTQVTLPEKPRIVESKNNVAIIEINGCYPGYGNTLGNSLRRALLSSLPGAAITVIKIKGVRHEFSTIPYVLDDVIQIMLNLKQIRFKVYAEEPVMVTLKVKGEKEVTAKDIKCPSTIEIVNPDVYIAAITDKRGELDMELWVERGLGYIPQESRKREKLEVGTIALDALFTPIRKVSYKIENMRVGDRTDYNRLIFTIETDGTISPKEAFKQAAQNLVDHFQIFAELNWRKEDSIQEKAKVKSEKRDKKALNPLKIKLNDLKLPLKIINLLTSNKIKTMTGLVKKRENDLKKIEGLGDKGIKDIKQAIGYLGLTLKN